MSLEYLLTLTKTQQKSSLLILMIQYTRILKQSLKRPVLLRESHVNLHFYSKPLGSSFAVDRDGFFALLPSGTHSCCGWRKSLGWVPGAPAMVSLDPDIFTSSIFLPSPGKPPLLSSALQAAFRRARERCLHSVLSASRVFPTEMNSLSLSLI